MLSALNLSFTLVDMQMITMYKFASWGLVTFHWNLWTSGPDCETLFWHLWSSRIHTAPHLCFLFHCYIRAAALCPFSMPSLSVQPPQCLLQSFVVPHRLLLGPGPSNVPARIVTAACQPMLGHLHPETIEVHLALQLVLVHHTLN